MASAKYHINVFWSDDDPSWIADAPDLRSCSALGATPTEAVAELQVAMAAWLEVAREMGHSVPEPRYRPDLGRAA